MATDRPLVVCVDDERPVLQALKRTLRREPFDVLATPEPAQALRWVSERPVDLVVSDQLMRGMTGAELLKAVRLRSPQTARAMLTGFPDARGVHEEDGEAVQCLLLKPWDDDEIRRRIRTLLAGWREARARATRDVELAETVVHIDCVSKSLAELEARVHAALRRGGDSGRGTALLLSGVEDAAGPPSAVYARLAGTLRRREGPVLVVERTGRLAGEYARGVKPISGVAFAPMTPPRRVLAVTDRENTTEFLRMLLNAAGHDVRTARSAVEAKLRLHDPKPYDVLLLDVETEGADRPSIEAPPIVRIGHRSMGKPLGRPFRVMELLNAISD